MKRTLIFIVLNLLINSTLINAQEKVTSSEITAKDIMAHIMILASDEFGGRKAGTPEGQKAAAYIAANFESFGLEPIGEFNSHFQPFEFSNGVKSGPDNKLTIRSGKYRISYSFESDFTPMGFSASKSTGGKAVFAGYGIASAENNYDDYEGIDIKDKIVIIMNGNVEDEDLSSKIGRAAELRLKVSTAEDRGAAGVLIYNSYTGNDYDDLPELTYESMTGKSGIPVVFVTRTIVEYLFHDSGKSPEDVENEINQNLKPRSFEIAGKSIAINTDLISQVQNTQNVVGLIMGTDPVLKDRYVVIGAHYDHLGLGEESSMAPSLKGQVHNGADDNASGVAGIIELAEKFASTGGLKRSLMFIAFAGEEAGLLGSNHYVENPIIAFENLDFMINFDMIGRTENNKLILEGSGSSPIWKDIIEEANAEFSLDLNLGKGGMGGSDHMPFYQAKKPFLFFFSGTHSDYHKPSDDIGKINSTDEEKIVRLTESILRKTDDLGEEITFVQEEQPADMPGSRMSLKVTLGVVPDFGGSDIEGMAISDVSSGGLAEAAGLKGGDVIVRIGNKNIKNIYDYMYILGKLNIGDTTKVIVNRAGQKIEFEITFVKK